jgi:uncharacterized protein (DUF1800 family)
MTDKPQAPTQTTTHTAAQRREFIHNIDKLVDFLAANPSTAKAIAHGLANAFVCDDGDL